MLIENLSILYNLLPILSSLSYLIYLHPNVLLIGILRLVLMYLTYQHNTCSINYVLTMYWLSVNNT